MTASTVGTDRLRDALFDVIDPDLGVNVVDLGFLYAIESGPDGRVSLRMTLTSPACPLTGVIEDQIRAALVDTGLATAVDVEWVFVPAWTPARITEDGRDQLSAIGFTL
ncbi:metal-sulfur cluster assembly factor [Pseudonocardia endophytica]|uniref:Metal-sulfur cluster biosynthetic enzyme n=1 Tax=Pseudonocardia endophytica TaxID=401976 RepID=A0A4R1HVJ3_PSEEN|nr:metal-sulfur cluster assembly factor [Pseudonocardia endophytica]TCK26764.1 metal-sulfur cluster biosynthetic enzyme [Pseudonocardia endophytica]